MLKLCLLFINSIALPPLCSLFSTDKSFCNLKHLRDFYFSLCSFMLGEKDALDGAAL